MVKTDRGRYEDAVEGKREATRALLLCIVAFFGSPHNAADGITVRSYSPLSGAAERIYF